MCAVTLLVCCVLQVTSKLLAPPKSSEKMYKIDDHCAVAVAGLTSDANILISYARVAAQRYRFMYDEPQPIEQTVQLLADHKHSYTQYGGLRPFGCSFLMAGWDKHYGYQLYQTDPSGNYSGWKATAIGANSAQAISSLKTEYSEDLSLEDAKKLAVKVLTKALDTTHPTAERIELSILTRDEATGKMIQRSLKASEIDELVAAVVVPETAAGSGTATASI